MQAPAKTLWTRARARVGTSFVVPFVCALLLATCTMGDAPLSPEKGAVSPSRLSIRPQFMVLGGAHQSAPINRIHLVARTQPGLVVVADTVLTVSPTDASWAVGLDLRLPEGLEQASVVVTIELINVTGTTQTVEWSGATAPIVVTAGGVTAPQAPVPVFPGPPSNLTVTSIAIAPDSTTLVEGDSAQLSATVTGASGTPLIVWSTLDPTIASISAGGSVRGVRNGIARVVAQAGPKADTVPVRFTQRPVSLRMIEDSVSFASLGQESSVTTRVDDARGDSIPGSAVSYLIRDTGVAELAGAGRVRARSNGRTYVIAFSAQQTAVRDSALIVVAQRIATATITPTTATLTALGATAAFSAHVRDANGNEIAAAVTWRSDNASVATVDGTGVARAVGDGVAGISAEFEGGASASATLTVTQIPATVRVTPSNIVLHAIGDTARAVAVVQDANGNAMGTRVTWSTSNGSVATVDTDGLVRAVGNGAAAITAAADGARDSAPITVRQIATRLTLSGAADSLVVGDTMRIRAEAFDALNHIVADAVITWRSSVAAAASVDQSGLVTAVAAGETDITAETAGASAVARIRTTARQPAAVTTDRSSVSLDALGDTARIAAIVRDGSGVIINTPVTWETANESVATVDTEGVIRAVGNGSTTVTARAGLVAAAVDVTVLQVATKVLLAGMVDSLQIADTVRITATALDARDNQIVAATITWQSSNSAVASVDGSGLVTAHATGSADITARAGNATAVTGIRTYSGAPNLVLHAFTLQPGDTLREGFVSSLRFVVRNTGEGPATSARVHLRVSLDPEGAVSRTDSVDIPMLGAGDSIAITRPVALDTLTAYPDSVFVSVHVDPHNVIPETAEDDNQTSRIVRVVLRAARVQVRDAAGTVDIDSISFDALGDTIQLSAIAYDRFNRPLPERVIFWGPAGVTEGPVAAAIDSLGRVRPFHAGVAFVRAQVEGREDTILVRVAPIPVALELMPDSLFLQPGDSAGIHAVLRDRTNLVIHDMQPEWLSSNPEVATIDADTRRVHAVSAGSVYIHATALALHDSVLVRVAVAGPPGHNTWTGTLSGSWNDIGNWSRGTVPTAADTVFIPAVANVPSLTGPVTIGGLNIVTGASLALNSHTMTVFDMAIIDGAVTDGTLRIIGEHADLHVNAPVLPSLEITGSTTQVFVPLPITVGGTLTINGGGRLIVGSTTIAAQQLNVSGGHLVMNHPDGRVVIAQDAFFDAGNTIGDLTGGELAVGGSFTVGSGSYEAFSASNTHVTVLNGTSAQAVSMVYADVVSNRQHFHNLRVENTAGVTLTGNIAVSGTVTLASGAGPVTGPGRTALLGTGLVDDAGTGHWQVDNTIVLSNNAMIPAALRTNLSLLGSNLLQSDFVLDGDLTIQSVSGMLDLNGHAITVAGSVNVVAGAQLSIGSGSLAAAQNLSVTQSPSVLRMNDPAGMLSIDGHAVFDGAQTVGTLTGGMLRVGGNFTVGAGSYEAFAANAAHTTRLDGATPQSISFAYPDITPGRQHFGNLEIANAAGVTFNSNAVALGTISIDAASGVITGAGRTVHIGGSLLDGAETGAWQVANTTMMGTEPVVAANLVTNLTFSGTATLQNNYDLDGTLAVAGAGAFLDLNGMNVTATGGVDVLSGAQLRIGAGSLIAAGNLRVLQSPTRLVMDHASGILDIGGSATFDAAQTVGSLTAGVLRVGGSFTVGSGSYEAFSASGTHQTVLNGSAVQVVSFAYPDVTTARQHFQNLEIANPAGVTFVTNAVALGNVVATAGPGTITGPGRTVIVGANLMDTGDAGSWSVANTHMMGSAPLVPASLATNLTFIGTTLLQNNFSLDGTLAVAGAGAVLDLNGMNLSVTGGVQAANGGELRVGSGTITAGGDLSVTAHPSRLRMDDAAGVLDIAGAAIFDAARTDLSLTAGTLRVGGAFTVGSGTYEGFAASGTHRTVLDGTAVQVVSFAYPGITPQLQRFQELEITNPAGVTFNSNAFVLGTVTLDAGAGIVTGPGRTVQIGGSLLDPGETAHWQVGTTIMTGATPTVPAALTTNLTFAGIGTAQNGFHVVGTLAVDGSGKSLDLNGNTINVTGDVRAVNGAVLNIADGTINASGGLEVRNGSSLWMQNAAGVLDVEGAALFDVAYTVGTLTNGILRVGGAFTVGSGTYEGFAPSGSHTTELDGDAAQTVSFAYPGAEHNRQHFHHLLISNTAGVSFTTLFFVNGNVEVRENAGTVTGATRPTPGGTLTDPGGHWRLGANLTLSSIATSPADNLFKGSTYPVRIVVRNTGSVATPSVSAQLVITEPLTGTPPVLAVLPYVIAAIQPGDSLVHDDVLSLNAELPVDAVRATLTVDNTSAVAEFDEADNSLSIVLQLLPALPAGSPAITKMWVGSSNSWNDPANWSPAGVPTASDALYIGTAPFSPTLDAGRTIGGLVIAAGASLNTQTSALIIAGGAIVQDSIVGSGAITFSGSGSISGTYRNALISGNRALAGATHIRGNVDISSGGRLDIAGATLTVDGSLNRDGGDLVMQNALGVADVAGSFFTNAGNSVGLLTAGTLRLGGDFLAGGSTQESFAPSGLHKVVFDGTGMQTVNFQHPGGASNRQHFNHVEIAQQASVDSVKFLNEAHNVGDVTITTGQVRSASDVYLAGSLADNAAPRWKATRTTLNGSAQALPSEISTNLTIATLFSAQNATTIHGNLQTLPAGTLRLNGQAVHVNGTLYVNGGGLEMTDAAGVLSTSGNVEFNAGSTVGKLTNGTLRIAGSFLAGGSTQETFAPSADHRTVFNGSGVQTVNFQHAGSEANRQHFMHLEVAQPNETDAVHFLNTAYVNGDVTISVGTVTGTTAPVHLSGDLLDATGGRWNAPKTTIIGSTPSLPDGVNTDLTLASLVVLPNGFTLNGDLRTEPSGTLRMNGQTVQVNGDIVINGGGLEMTNAADQLTLSGNIEFNAGSTVGKLIDGALRIGGNFLAGGSTQETFAPSAAHRTVFNGSGTQTINFQHPGAQSVRQHFQHLEVSQQSDTDAIQFLNSAFVNGDVTISTGRVTGAATVQIDGSIFDPVGGRWTAGTTILTGTAPALPATLTTNLVIGDAVELQNGFALTGNLTSPSPGLPGLLDLNGQDVSVSGSLTINEGALLMTNAADVLDVGGDVTFNAGTTVGRLTAGTLRIGGNFLAGGSTQETFAPSGSHTVVFDKAGAQSINFQHPGAAANRQHFHNVQIAATSTTTFLNNAFVNGTLFVSGTAVNSGVLDVLQQLTIDTGATLTNNGTVTYTNGLFTNLGTVNGTGAMTGIVR